MMTVRRAALWVLICFVGFIVGILFDAEYHPNYMMVWVENNQIDLGAQQNDVLQWRTINAENGTAPATITFKLGGIPCSSRGNYNLSTGYCFVDYPVPAGTYPYKCTDEKGNQVCDPNNGPTSGSGGGVGWNGGKDGKNDGKLSRPGSLSLLGLSGYFSALGSNFAASLSSPPATAHSGSEAPTAARSSSTVNAYVGCNSQQPAQVAVIPNPIQIAQQGTISWRSTWGPSGNQTFLVTDPAGVCTSGTTPCTLKASLPSNPYLQVTVNFNGASCANNPLQVPIVVSSNSVR